MIYMYKSALLLVAIVVFITNNSLAQSEEKGDSCKTIPNTDFRISVLDSTPIPIPTDHFSIRQNLSIHLFKSKDAENWQYAGEIIGKGNPGEWTANGIATPGNIDKQGHYTMWVFRVGCK